MEAVARDNQVHTISWFENLRRATYSLLLHPFLPLHDFKFSYGCLFSDQSYCNIETRNYSILNNSVENPSTNREDESNLIVKFVDFISKSLNSARGSPRDDKSLTDRRDHFKTSDKVSRFYSSNEGFILKSYNAFLVGQLIICTFILAHFLIKDLKHLTIYFKTFRRN